MWKLDKGFHHFEWHQKVPVGPRVSTVTLVDVTVFSFAVGNARAVERVADVKKRGVFKEATIHRHIVGFGRVPSKSARPQMRKNL